MTVFKRHPVDNPVISQPFGAKNDWESPPWHKGIDYAALSGTPIYAPCDGFVVWASGQPFGYGNTWEMIPGNGNSGNCVIIQPPAPHTSFQTSFSHMSGITVKAGQWVNAGDLIGYVGNTGFSFGAHLHWEAFIDYAEGSYPAGTFYGRVNPLDYFSTATVVPIGTGGKGTTTPKAKGFLMALTDKQQQELYDRVLGGIPGKPFRPNTRVADDKDMTDLPHRVLSHEVQWYGYDGKAQPKGKRTTTTLATFIGWLDSGINNLMTGINKANEGIAGLTAAVKALSEKQGVDPAELERLIDKAVSEAAEKHLSDIGTYELRKVEES